MQASRLLGSTIPPSDSISNSKSADLNKDDFLKLLMTQMQHQDPLNPMDNTEFLSQLSQFSQLEQIYNVNQNIQDLAASQNSSRDMLLGNLLGKTAKVDASDIYLKDQDNISINYDLADSAEKVTVNIYDADRNLVRTIQAIQQPSGQQKLDWDGKDNDKKDLPEGTYSIEVTANNKGALSFISPYLMGPVNEVIFSQGNEPLIQIENQNVPISKVLQISMAQPLRTVTIEDNN